MAGQKVQDQIDGVPPSVMETAGGEVRELREAIIVLSRSILKPASEDVWEEIAAVASRVEYAADKLYLRARSELRKFEVAA